MELGPGDLEGVVDVDPRQLADRLGDGPERDAVTVGKAPSPHRHRFSVDPRDEFGREPRLASSRRSDHREQAAGSILHGTVERVAEVAEFAGASHEGRVGSPREVAHGRDVHQAVRGDREPLPLQDHR